MVVFEENWFWSMSTERNIIKVFPSLIHVTVGRPLKVTNTSKYTFNKINWKKKKNKGFVKIKSSREAYPFFFEIFFD